MKNKEECLIELIDYLLEDYGGDCCAKCIHCAVADKDGNIPPCKPFDQDGNVGCRNGMIAWFENQEKIKRLKTFGEILAQKREEKGWSQTMLAERVGVCNKSICEWEKGNNSPNSIWLECLADVFECTLDELVGR